MNSTQQYRLADVRKVFARDQVALDGIGLTVCRGERVALIGPSGAGKTTLFRLLNCTLRPTAGKLWIGDEDVESLHGKRLRQTRSRIGSVYQQHNLVPRLRVIHNVLAGQLGRWTTFGSLISLFKPADVELARQALQQVGIPEKLLERTDELSGGQQQRVAIARVLVQNPDVILADEPVSSVDPSLASTIVRLLIEISQSRRKTLIVSLHGVDLALAYFPRIVGIKEGRVEFDLETSKITEAMLEDLYSGNFRDHSVTEEVSERVQPIAYPSVG